MLIYADGRSVAERLRELVNGEHCASAKHHVRFDDYLVNLLNFTGSALHHIGSRNNDEFIFLFCTQQPQTCKWCC